MANSEYVVVSDEVGPASPSMDEVKLIRKSARWVVMLALTQLFAAIWFFLAGGFLFFLLTVIFVSFGLVGACRKRVKMLVAHFVYSLLLYILSLAGVVLLFVYCTNCSWPVYLWSFLFVLIQAIGMRHSRILIAMLKRYDACQLPTTACRYSNSCSSQTQTTVSTPVATQTTEMQSPTAPLVPPPPYPQYVTMPIQPQYYPLMQQQQQHAVRYPYTQQPIAIMPQYMYQQGPVAPQYVIPSTDHTTATNLYPGGYSTNTKQ